MIWAYWPKIHCIWIFHRRKSRKELKCIFQVSVWLIKKFFFCKMSHNPVVGPDYIRKFLKEQEQQLNLAATSWILTLWETEICIKPFWWFPFSPDFLWQHFLQHQQSSEGSGRVMKSRPHVFPSQERIPRGRTCHWKTRRVTYQVAWGFCKLTILRACHVEFLSHGNSSLWSQDHLLFELRIGLA